MAFLNWLKIDIDVRSSNSLRLLAQRLYAYVIPLTIALALLFLFPFRHPGHLIASILMLSLVRWFALGSPFPQTPVNGLILALWIALAIGLAITPVPHTGIAIIAIAVTGSLLVWGIYELPRAEAVLWSCTAGLVLVGTAVAAAVPFIVLNPAEKLFEYPAWYIRLVPHLAAINSNQLAGALEGAVPLAIGLVIGSRQWRIVGVVCLPVLVLGLMLLQSRGALVGLGAALIVYGALYRRWVLPVCLLLAVVLVWVNSLFPSTTGIGAILERSQASAGANLNTRADLWQETSTWLMTRPFGLGVGAYPVYWDAYLSDALDSTLRPHTHQLFLQVGLDAGFVGLAAFVSLVTFALYGLWRAYRHRSDRHLYSAFLAAWVAMLIHGAVDTVYWRNRTGLFLWAVLGVSLALARYATHRHSRSHRHPGGGSR